MPGPVAPKRTREATCVAPPEGVSGTGGESGGPTEEEGRSWELISIGALAFIQKRRGASSSLVFLLPPTSIGGGKDPSSAMVTPSIHLGNLSVRRATISWRQQRVSNTPIGGQPDKSISKWAAVARMHLLLSYSLRTAIHASLPAPHLVRVSSSNGLVTLWSCPDDYRTNTYNRAFSL